MDLAEIRKIGLVLVKPTFYEGVAIFVFISIFFAAVFVASLQANNPVTEIVQSSVAQFFTDKIEYVSDAVEESVLFTNLGVTIFWALFGMVVYLVFWSAFVALKEVNYSFSVAFDFIHPKSFDSKRYWVSILLEKVYFVVMAVVVLVFGRLVIDGFLQFFVDESILLFADVNSEAIWKITYLALTLTVLLHVLTVLIRAMLGTQYLKRRKYGA